MTDPPVQVLGVAGEGGRDRLEDLRLEPGVRLRSSPRHAAVLLVTGKIPAAHLEALARIHDQIPHPRATLWWGPRSGDRSEGMEISADDDPIRALATLRDALRDRTRDSEAHWLPDEPPHPWKGRGDHGQGGEGMMGGTPYGRPMAMTDEDVRDGLALDRLPFTVGPFFPHFPPGLVLEVALQGDVIQEARVQSTPYPQPKPSRLRRLHRILAAAGAHALAERALRWAGADPTDDRQVDRFQRRLRWTGFGTRLCPVPGVSTDAPDDLNDLHDLEDRLPGMEWGRAVLTIAGGTP